MKFRIKQPIYFFAAIDGICLDLPILAVLTLCVVCFQTKTLVGQDSDFFWEQRVTPQSESAQNNTLIRMSVEIDNRPKLFIIDTAAKHVLDTKAYEWALSQRRYEQEGVSVFEQSSDSEPALALGNYVVSLKDVQRCDLSSLSRIVGDNIFGILGLPFVSRFGIGYDDQGEYFYVGRASIRNFEASFPLQLRDSGLYTSDVSTGIGPIACVIDTGQNTPISTDSVTFDELISRGHLTQLSDARIQTLQGSRVVRFGIVASIEVWGTRFYNVPIIESTGNAIGINLMRKFDFYLDTRNEIIEISRNSQTKTPFQWDRSGIGIGCYDGKIVVDAVKPQSPAEKGNLIVGTTVVEVNNRKVEANWQELCCLRELLSTPGPTSVSLVGKTGDSERAFQIAW